MKAMAIIYSFGNVIASAFQRSNVLKLTDHFGKSASWLLRLQTSLLLTSKHFNQENKDEERSFDFGRADAVGARQLGDVVGSSRDEGRLSALQAAGLPAFRLLPESVPEIVNSQCAGAELHFAPVIFYCTPVLLIFGQQFSV
jgi:hypothetical protein